MGISVKELIAILAIQQDNTKKVIVSTIHGEFEILSVSMSKDKPVKLNPEQPWAAEIKKRDILYEIWRKKMGQNETEICIVDGLWGVYVPERFVSQHEMSKWGVCDEDVAAIKKGPEFENYWETWDDILTKAQYKDDFGNTWTLHQDGDLFARRQDHPEMEH